MIQLSCGHYAEEDGKTTIGDTVTCVKCEARVVVMTLITFYNRQGEECLPEDIVITEIK